MLLIEKKVKTELKEKRANVGPKSQDVLVSSPTTDIVKLDYK